MPSDEQGHQYPTMPFSCYKFIRSKMDSWKGDSDLRTDLNDFVRKNFTRLEMLDFLEKKYPTYSWSLRTLARRLRYFDIKYVRDDVDLGQVEEAIRKEMTYVISKMILAV